MKELWWSYYSNNFVAGAAIFFTANEGEVAHEYFCLICKSSSFVVNLSVVTAHGCRCWTWFIIINARQRVGSVKAMLIIISTFKLIPRVTVGFIYYSSISGCALAYVSVSVCAFHCHSVLIKHSLFSWGAKRRIFLFWFIVKLISNSLKLCKQDLTDDAL